MDIHLDCDDNNNGSVFESASHVHSIAGRQPNDETQSHFYLIYYATA